MFLDLVIIIYKILLNLSLYFILHIYNSTFLKFKLNFGFWKSYTNNVTL